MKAKRSPKTWKIVGGRIVVPSDIRHVWRLATSYEKAMIAKEAADSKRRALVLGRWDRAHRTWVLLVPGMIR